MSYEDAYGENADIFYGGMPNPKIEERRALLAAHPELRLRVDPDPLCGIIPFAAFKCAPGSSVARDEAIQGSDIDGGLVVSHQPTSAEAEIAFIDELRAQGFEVYHPSEVSAANAAYEDALARGAEPTEYDQLRSNRIDLDLKRVDFIPEDELRSADPFGHPGSTYKYGYTIAECPDQE